MFLLKLDVNCITLMCYQLIAKGVIEEIPLKARQRLDRNTKQWKIR